MFNSSLYCTGYRNNYREGKEMIKLAFGVAVILGGLFLMGWLAGYVMLYGGIVQAIEATSTGQMVGGIIMALFFELE